MWFNPIVRSLLRSPFYGLAGKHTMLIGYRGSRSGKYYETPVNFVRDGRFILVTSRPERTWWRNMEGEAGATLRLEGKDVQSVGKAFTSREDVIKYLGIYLNIMPQVAKYFEVRLDECGLPLPEDVERAARQRVIVRFQLPELPSRLE
jgi:hypothetical protein